LSSRRGMDPPMRASESAQQSESHLVQLGGSRSAAGIGAVFGVAECGAVFFNTAVLGSSCWTALGQKQIQHGDVLFAVDGFTLYRAPLKTVASKLLGPAGSVVQVVFRRGPKTITLQCQRSVPDIKAAQLVLSKATRSQGERNDLNPSVSPATSSPGESCEPLGHLGVV